MNRHRIRVSILLALMFGLSQCFLASSMGQTLPSETPQTFTPTNAGFEYARRKVMIPMRDGVKLHTVQRD